MRAEITPAQRKVLLAIHRLHEQHGYAPTVRELCEATNTRSTSTVWFHLIHLRDAGLIPRADLSQARVIRLAEGVVVHDGEVYIAEALA